MRVNVLLEASDAAEQLVAFLSVFAVKGVFLVDIAFVLEVHGIKQNLFLANSLAQLVDAQLVRTVVANSRAWATAVFTDPSPRRAAISDLFIVVLKHGGVFPSRVGSSAIAAERVTFEVANASLLWLKESTCALALLSVFAKQALHCANTGVQVAS